MPPLLSCQNISKSFLARPLFREISLSVLEGERIGLIGPNGSGKSTLLKILAGLEKPDSGTVAPRRGLRAEYVAQEDSFPAGLTVSEVLHEALRPQNLDPLEVSTQVQIMLAKIGFPEPDQLAERLSGGWRKRLALARALIREPELLLLDEPTNHLDLEGVMWLEKLLSGANFALIAISHDRYFLENVISRLMELNRSYPDGYLNVEGTYSDFLIQKEEFLHAQQQQQHALSIQVKREVEWLRRGPQARTTKAKFRIEEAGRMMDDLAELAFRNAQERSVDIDFSATKRKANELLSLRGVGKTMGDRRLFEGVDVILSHKTRLGMIGANGSGKTTLLRILAGELEPDAGEVKRAERLRIVRFDQNRAQLDKNASLRTALSPNSDYVPFRGGTIHIAGWAQRFLFQTAQLDMAVGSLSGGEQARVLIARLMVEPADVLILDEPTNDLDIPSLEVLEESLLEFPGAVVLVTHDRYLLDRVSTELLALDGKGGVAMFAEYSQWEEAQKRILEATSRPAPVAKAAPKAPPQKSQRLSTAERRELEGMEEAILAAESAVEALQASLQSPEIVADHRKMEARWKEIQDAEARVAALYARWEELEARR